MERIHRAVSPDGTEIVGRVRGRGPALVLVHGAIGDGEIAWEALLPELTDRFTCYLPSTRGRGLSADHPDHSPPRLVEDVTAFVDGIGEPVGLVGWSGSGAWVLGAAARSRSVAAVAVHEPVLIPVMGPDDLAETAATMQRIGAAAGAGRLVDALHAFAPWICTAEEVAALERTDFFQRWAGAVPAMLRLLQQDGSYAGPRATDPEALAAVTAPVLLLVGKRTRLHPFFTASARFLARHVVHGQVWELPGLGHFAPVLAPRSVAEELVTFFESARQPA
ncbi:alpha/beta fold hydrolase [Saccharothrix variisporea]|uniref:Pimeloyl-ACP methyl ester carboxylesterase n=1 Tax=Saccharothrix variisporea TaxID=543527 RepID=A0A495XKV0_9PSEU|nr:alpha/beta hydrolase [Saccharothrix variisporea]RKT75110.1 pimeloyl-ACP methyl ester carboxylesterase [Saccharothrix variisporea]